MAATTANLYRPDVGTSYPGSGDYHGFLLHLLINDDVPNNGDGCFSVRITASYGNWP